MRRLPSFTLILSLGLPASLGMAADRETNIMASTQLELGSRSIKLIERDGFKFRDLDRNGELTPYEDWRLSPEQRAQDLLSRMSLEEKAGAMMHGTLPAIGAERGTSRLGYDLERAKPLLLDKNITAFITRLATTPHEMAVQNNLVQAIAEEGRLGIPVTVSTDPRHHFLYVLGQSAASIGFSRWPESLGFAALRDSNAMRRFADIARLEYRATGIHQALSPQVDLFTDPRWARGFGGFGSNPELSREMAHAYVAGFQGGTGGIGRDSVIATVKHWVGYGATVGGLDGHSYYGRYARVDARSFKMHIKPFEGAFEAKVGAVMPTYDIVEGAIVDGKPVETVGAGFSRQMLTDLLRGTYHFDGLILSDWAVTNDCTASCMEPSQAAPQRSADLGMPWGVETLTRLQRFAKGIDAGIDQFGGVAEPERILEAEKAGLVSQARIDASVLRVMTLKFALGLFDNPFVDPERAAREVNTPDIASLALKTQAKAQVLLKNDRHLLPLRAGTKVYARGVDDSAIKAAGLVSVSDVRQAEVALVRIDAPFETLHPYHLIGSLQHEGRLDYPKDNGDIAAIDAAAAHVPVIAALFLDRPAILGDLNKKAAAILANFGVSDDALLQAVTGSTPPKGRLPFEMPSSMKEVEAQNPALPDDTRHPLYRFGAGILPPK
jgi:beta-glucosidase